MMNSKTRKAGMAHYSYEKRRSRRRKRKGNGKRWWRGIRKACECGIMGEEGEGPILDRY